MPASYRTPRGNGRLLRSTPFVVTVKVDAVLHAIKESSCLCAFNFSTGFCGPAISFKPKGVPVSSDSNRNRGLPGLYLCPDAPDLLVQL